MGRLAYLPLVFFLASACDVFVTGVGGEGEPCFGDGTCKSGLICNSSDICEACYASCTGKKCGDDGCGGSCGTCSSGEICASGTCVDIFASITEGTFYMGSSSGDFDEKPVHQVTVPSFEMMRTEVTVDLYRHCVNAGNCTAPGTGPYCNWNVNGRDDHPINCVDWYQASSFCQWASGRLPSEAEWEYAARSGGQDIKYPWGDQTATCQYAVMSEGGYGCGQDRTWSVCGKTDGNTSQGLSDMAGNVWEWVQDWHHSDYNGAPSDGSAWESPSGEDRVLRGGSWSNVAGSLRTSDRLGYYPGSGGNNGGFRCAR